MYGNSFSKPLFGSQLGKRMKQLGYDTHRQLARVMLGFPKDYRKPTEDEKKRIENLGRNINNWELGNTLPSLHDFVILCDVLDCDADYLLSQSDVHRKDTKDIERITGLSIAASDALRGICQYGPKHSLYALEKLLESEDSWRFTGHFTDSLDGINPLLYIGNYFSSLRDENLYLVNAKENLLDPRVTVQISGLNVIAPGQNFIDRMNLDTILDAMKEIKKANEKNAIEKIPMATNKVFP